MPERRSPDDAGPDRRRLVFVLCSVIAAAAGGVLVASAGAGGLAGSPIDEALPGEELSGEQITGNPGSVGDIPGTDGDIGPIEGGLGSVPGLGSLSPGAQTGAGGDLGFDNDTFASTETDVHFTAESSRPTYWRTAAYRTYTGTGWNRPAETESYDPPLQSGDSGRIAYNVTLRQPATALPTPWQPTVVGGLDQGVAVTAEGDVTPTGRLSNGTTFTGVSNVPESNPALLRSVDDTTPPAIEPYTELPDSVPPRLSVQADNIAADADGRYETARAIERWLQDEKEYSLSAFQESSQVADTFAFEMEAGYCEYFATTMAVMLRTQDIPTRYALGYSSGQYVGNDTYQVREMNAHAWVEVYFEGVGWVQFDPTPGGPRLQTQEQALDGEYNVSDPGSPGQTLDLEENDSNTDGWSVSFDQTPVPGEETRLVVRLNGDPVRDVRVLFDGEPVGTTGLGGGLTARVPDESFEVSVVGEVAGSDDLDSSVPLRRGGRSVVGSGAPPVSVATQDRNETTVYRETVEVETGADIEPTGQVRPGAGLEVTVQVGDNPIEGATVRVDGEERAETNNLGRATVTLPSEPGAVTLTAERGPVTGERTFDVPELAVTVEPDWPVALPFTPATVEATYDGEAAAGLPVTVDGDRVGATGPDGTTTVRLPFGRSAEVTAIGAGVTVGATVDGLLRGVLLVVLPVGALCAVVVLVRRRQTETGGGTWLQDAGSGLVSRLLVVGSGRIVTTVQDVVGLVLVTVGLRAPPDDTGPAGPVSVGDDDPPTEEQAAVRAAWNRFLDQVSAPAATLTPAELATHAIEEDGLPAEPVCTLRDAFRAVEYGSRPAEPSRVQAAVDAIEANRSDSAGAERGDGGAD